MYLQADKAMTSKIIQTATNIVIDNAELNLNIDAVEKGLSIAYANAVLHNWSEEDCIEFAAYYAIGLR